jgi:ATP-binding cassette subfamily B multidrug efflux pump
MSATTTTNQDKTDEKRKGRITDSDLFWMLWQFLKPFKWQLAGVGILLLAVSALEVSLPFLIQQAVDGPITQGELEGIVPFGVAYLVAVFVLFAMRFGYTYWLQTIGQNALRDLRQRLFEHIVKQDLNYFNTTPVGRIVSRMSNDIEALTELLSTSIVMIASNLLTLIGIIVMMLALNWRLALFSLAVIPLMAFMSGYFRVRIRRSAKRFHQIMADYQAYLNEQFNGMLVVQLFGRQKQSRDDFNDINQEYFNIHTELRIIYTLYGSGLQLLTTFGLALVLWGGGQGVLAEWATLGMLIAFIEYTRRSFDPILMLSEQFAQIQTAFSAGERIAKMLQVESSVQEKADAGAVGTFKQTIHFEDIRFSYKEGHPVINGISVDIAEGQKVAIVGATGAGKTTLVKLLARYYDVDEGAIKLDGKDLRDLSFHDLRRMITVVPQSPYCFNGTIADNLRLFDPSITREQMQEAARVACADRFIERLPDSYDFELLPGGANLSEGQRQLLALARALIHSPESILVLDEATSSIDTETEADIQEGLAHIMANRTTIIIAHRLSTVRDADRILVMQQGRIVEDGNHDELVSLGGIYAQLHERQFDDIDLAQQELSA